MNYDVEWLPDAVDAIQRIVDATTDPEGVANAVTRVGLELAARPTLAGESRERGRRILFKYPLVVWFRIDERLKRVLVYQVRQMRPA